MPSMTPKCVGREEIYFIGCEPFAHSKNVLPTLLIHSPLTHGRGRRRTGAATFLRSQFDFKITTFTGIPKAELAQSHNLGAVEGIAVFWIVSKVFEIVEPTAAPARQVEERRNLNRKFCN
jgi:hypothetical protein